MKVCFRQCCKRGGNGKKDRLVGIDVEDDSRRCGVHDEGCVVCNILWASPVQVAGSAWLSHRASTTTRLTSDPRSQLRMFCDETIFIWSHVGAVGWLPHDIVGFLLFFDFGCGTVAALLVCPPSYLESTDWMDWAILLYQYTICPAAAFILGSNEARRAKLQSGWAKQFVETCRLIICFSIAIPCLKWQWQQGTSCIAN